MAWRLAKSLETLRAQVNAKWPNRSKVSDGTIGDAAHQATRSEHNPDENGVVRAIDITHDPVHGLDTWRLAEVLRVNRDPRIMYVISNGRIFSSSVNAWEWRPYHGSNAHAHHIHISVSSTPGLYDLEAPWKLDPNAGPILPKPVQAPPKGITADMRRRMGKAIVDFEARRVNGHLAVYRLPANDGGGTYEVAGINDRYHPAQAQALKSLIENGHYDEAERSVADYLAQYTNVAAGWTTDAGVEFYLRDCVFNRGPKGAARILQRAVGVPDDGEVGPQTRAAMSTLTADQLITKLRWAREDYERHVVGYRANFWLGLSRRWDKALELARAFQKEQGALPKSVKVGVPVGVAAFSLWDWIIAHPFLAALIVGAAAIAGFAAFNAIRHWRERPPEQPIAPVPAIIEA